ncbi:hypothetical protein MP638_007182 [Amoeboaphelidium occidentale]|nr:hypothetical protein MP638_007182 [Amoeboaphelidium occidentale]
MIEEKQIKIKKFTIEKDFLNLNDGQLKLDIGRLTVLEYFGLKGRQGAGAGGAGAGDKLKLEYSTNSSDSSTAVELKLSFKCLICNHYNSLILECSNCGVVNSLQDLKEVSCLLCTFTQSAKNTQCEMCGNQMVSTTTTTTTTSTTTTTTTTSKNDVVVYSLYSDDVTLLQRIHDTITISSSSSSTSTTSYTSYTYTKTGGLGGYDSLLKKISSDNQKVSQSIQDSFKDITQLMSNAKELVKLSAQLSSKLNRESTMSSSSSVVVAAVVVVEDDDDDDDQDELLQLLQSSGLVKSSKKYLKEMSVLINGFIEKKFSSSYNDNDNDNNDTRRIIPRMVSLYDLYCLFCRRYALYLSPREFYDCVEILVKEQQNGSNGKYSLKEFPSSGLKVLVINDSVCGGGGGGATAASSRILEMVDLYGRLSVLQVGKEFGVSMEIAQEILMGMVLSSEVKDGSSSSSSSEALLCVDDCSVEGVYYYRNRFLLM